MIRSTVHLACSLRSLAAGLILVTVLACDNGTTAPIDDDVTEIRLTSSDTFEPADVVISPGTTVRWVNDIPRPHTVTPDGHAEWEEWVTNQGGDTFEHTFETEGEFEYFCVPHLAQGMTGVIRVQ